MSQITIIDYGSGNLHSIAKAFEKEAGSHKLKVVISDKADDVDKASHIVLPGVGAFGDCIKGLQGLEGMMDSLHENVRLKKKPFMGVCVGMQMLADEGMENGSHKGLGWISGKVLPLKPSDPNLKIPHMGWNEIRIEQEHPVLEGISSGDHVYFVHSYHFDCTNKNNALASVDYGQRVVSVIANDNIVAAQFHPEKSQQVGLKFISNFLNM
ncbi:MAG: imidazole glycerol phosphate synthase subunit HisH [Alphaproteobacteria bacterium CG11_big_fil_rev_8_21_14_0_20_39_49]|nr:MAG: imidazole glycerol phosphate synthase subunit HisH [Alphaproteobacteria bacterium CG11_big_fil_rev_8_21_14_0_20_39_49]